MTIPVLPRNDNARSAVHQPCLAPCLNAVPHDQRDYLGTSIIYAYLSGQGVPQ